MSEDYQAFFKALAYIAANETLPHFRENLTVENKHDRGFDPVTQADKNTEAAIRNAIRTHFPNDSILGEELGTYQGTSDITWVIDPIDGTRSFMVGIPVWGTLVGVLRNGKPIAGMMAQPFTGELYMTIDDSAVLLHNSIERHLSTRAIPDLSSSILMTTGLEFFSAEEAPRFKAISNTVQLTRYGTDCYAYCMLAAGHIDLVVEAGLNLYDIAALIPIMQNAGAVVTDWQGNPFGETRQILAAANKELHTAALSILSQR